MAHINGSALMNNLKLFYMTQDQERGYDTYDSCIVVAETPEEAIRINPSPSLVWIDDEQGWGFKYADGRLEPEYCTSWANNIDRITVFEIGILTEPNYTSGTVVCASFNAG
jgi:hypothetical protein